VPGAVSIPVGGTVDFIMDGVHQVAIYEPGIKPKDISINGPGPFVNDEDGRIFIGGLQENVEFTFNAPGKYLVICNIAPHFEEAQMWGWVHVK
jgi:plastocyanin